MRVAEAETKLLQRGAVFLLLAHDLDAFDDLFFVDVRFVLMTS
jgi:hypothetical protein